MYRPWHVSGFCCQSGSHHCFETSKCILECCSQPSTVSLPHWPPSPTWCPNHCSKFLNFFQAKLDSIYQQLLVPAPPTPSTPPPQVIAPSAARLPHCGLSSFSPVDALQVAKLVTEAKATTCSLDAMSNITHITNDASSPSGLPWVSVSNVVTLLSQ